MKLPRRLGFVSLLGLIACGSPLLATEVPSVRYHLAEPSVGRTSSGAVAVTDLDGRASGTQWVRFESSAGGEWMQFTLPNVPPGRYQLALGYQGSTGAGSWRIEWREADGARPVTLHPNFDFTARTAVGAHGHRQYAFRTAEVGFVSNALPGYRTIRFTRLDATATPAQIGFASLTLLPAPGLELAVPTLKLGETGSTHQELRWPAGAAHESMLIERAKAGDTEWLSVGYAPASAGRFDSAGLLPQSIYRHRIRFFNTAALGPASAVVEARTAALEASPLGSVIDATGARLGEGSVARLKDGRMLMLLNYQDRIDDFGTFSIQRKESRDNGASWSPIEPMLHDDSGNTGYLMPSILRLQSGGLGFSYAVRNNQDLRSNRVYQFSVDEGATWSDRVVITHDLPLTHEGIVFTGATGPHDRLIQAANGDLFLPVHYTTGRGDEDRDPHHNNTPPLLISTTVVYRSIDGGAKWQRVFGPVLLKGTSQRSPYAYHWFDQVLSEPSLVEYAPGQLLLMMRNQSGYIQQSRSLDGGTTWSPVHAAPVRAGLAPPKLLPVGPGRIALIFNPHVNLHQGNLGDRFVLGSLVSDDGGLSWHAYRTLDVNPPEQGRWLCYPFFIRNTDSWLAFYFGPDTFDLCFRKLPADWFDR